MKKRRKTSKQNRNKQRRNKYRKSKIAEYKAKVNNINEIIRDYYSLLGSSGLEYNNLLTTVEKILGDVSNENSPFYSQGSLTKSARLSTIIAETTDLKTKRKITKLNKLLDQLPSASEIAEMKYNYTGSQDKREVDRIKQMSSLNKLKSDVLPNYYEALSTISTRKSQKFRKMFSDKLTGKKRNSQEYRDAYEEIGNEIIDYLEKSTDVASNVINRLSKQESVFDDLSPSTLSNLLRRK